MGQYRKQPVVIEAIQFDGVEQVDGTSTAMFEGRFDDLPYWLVEAMTKKEGEPGALFVFGDGLTIVTLEGPHRADPKDWVIRGVAGEIYPCKPDIFALTYVDAADGVVEIAGGDSTDWRERAETAEAERDAAIERADKAEAGEKKAKAEIRKASAPARLRKIAVLDDDKALHGEDLQKAIADADEVVIAFSDGQREVAGVSPIEVTGDAWRPHHFGLLLNTPVELVGPNDGPSASIDGYALLLDGKQVAYCQRPQPLQLAAGQRINLAGDIIFK